VFSKFLGTKSKFIAATVIAGATLTAGGLPAAAATKLGVLECDVQAGVGWIFTSQKSMFCTFSPEHGRPEHYTGVIRKFGLDIGVTAKTVIVWGVVAEQSGYPAGALAGHYGGVSAEASIVFGAGANALVGGSNRSIALQPLSVQGQAGINLALGVTALDLYAAR
jgi:hypothetical protein